MSNELSVLTEDIYNQRDQFAAVLSDKELKFDAEAGFALQVLASSNYLRTTALNNRASLVDAITNVAAIGISLNPARKQAYLVPRKVAGQMKVCLDISYMGMMDLALSSGAIVWVQAHVVREGDQFTLNGVDKAPLHTFDPFDSERNKLKIVGAYVVAKTREGDYLTTAMDIDSIYKIRNRSESWKSHVADKSKPTPWVTDEVEMIKKTVVKNAAKYWRDVPRLERAVHYLTTHGEGAADLSGGGAEEEDTVPTELLKSAQDAAKKGEAAYAAFWKATGKANRQLLSSIHESLKATAKAADSARTIDMPPDGEKKGDGATPDPEFVAAMDRAEGQS